MTEYEGSLKTHLTAGPWGGGNGQGFWGVWNFYSRILLDKRIWKVIYWGALIEAEILWRYSIQSEDWCSRAWVCQLHSSTWLSIIKLLLLLFDNLMHSGYWVWARSFFEGGGGGGKLVFSLGISSKAVWIFWLLIFCLFYYFALVEFICICIFRFFFRKNFSWSPRAYFLAADLSRTISSRH